MRKASTITKLLFSLLVACAMFLSAPAQVAGQTCPLLYGLCSICYDVVCPQIEQSCQQGGGYICSLCACDFIFCDCTITCCVP